MEIPRHWRLKDWRYKLQGWKYSSGAFEIMPRPVHDKKIELRVENGTIFSSKSPSYTSNSCMEVPGKEPQMQEL